MKVDKTATVKLRRSDIIHTGKPEKRSHPWRDKPGEGTITFQASAQPGMLLKKGTRTEIVRISGIRDRTFARCQPLVTRPGAQAESSTGSGLHREIERLPGLTRQLRPIGLLAVEFAAEISFGEHTQQFRLSRME